MNATLSQGWRRLSRFLDALRKRLCPHPEVDYVALAPSALGGGYSLVVNFNVCRRCGKEGV